MGFPLSITVYADGSYEVGPVTPPPTPESTPITVSALPQRKVTELSGEGIDARQEIIGNWYNALRSSTAKTAVGQWIAAPPVAPIVAVEVSLVRVGTLPPSSLVWLELQDASDAVLATSEGRDPNTISATESLWTRFDLTPSMQPGAGFRIVMRGDYPIDSSNFLLLGGTVNDVVPSGHAQEFNGTAWWAASAHNGYTVADHGFRVIVAASLGWTEPDPTLAYAVSEGSLAPGETFSGGLTRQAGDLPGVYPITLGTLAAPAGYALSFVGANLTVSARPAPTLGTVPILLAGQSNAVYGHDALAAWCPIPATSSHGSTPIGAWANGESYWTELASGLTAHPEIAALVWWQGESDAGAALASSYAATLRDLLARVRALRPGLPIIIVSIGPPHADFEEPARTTIFEAQHAVGSEPGNMFIDVSSVGHTGQHCSTIGYERAAYFVARALGVAP